MQGSWLYGEAPGGKDYAIYLPLGKLARRFLLMKHSRLISLGIRSYDISNAGRIATGHG